MSLTVLCTSVCHGREYASRGHGTAKVAGLMSQLWRLANWAKHDLCWASPAGSAGLGLILIDKSPEAHGDILA